jgi:hypothetical protein
MLSDTLHIGAGLGDRGSIPGRSERIFPLASVSRPALRPTQPPVQWVPGVLSLGVERGQDVMQTTHPHLVPRSKMRDLVGAIDPLLQAPSWRVVGRI